MNVPPATSSGRSFRSRARATRSARRSATSRRPRRSASWMTGTIRASSVATAIPTLIAVRRAQAVAGSRSVDAGMLRERRGADLDEQIGMGHPLVARAGLERRRATSSAATRRRRAGGRSAARPATSAASARPSSARPTRRRARRRAPVTATAPPRPHRAHASILPTPRRRRRPRRRTDRSPRSRRSARPAPARAGAPSARRAPVSTRRAPAPTRRSRTGPRRRARRRRRPASRRLGAGRAGRPGDRLGERLPVAEDVRDPQPDGNLLALGRADARERAGRRRLDLDRHLVGLDLDQRLALRDLSPSALSQRIELAGLLGHAEHRHDHLGRQARRALLRTRCGGDHAPRPAPLPLWLTSGLLRCDWLSRIAGQPPRRR